MGAGSQNVLAWLFVPVSVWHEGGCSEHPGVSTHSRAQGPGASTGVSLSSSGTSHPDPGGAVPSLPPSPCLLEHPQGDTAAPTAELRGLDSWISTPGALPILPRLIPHGFESRWSSVLAAAVPVAGGASAAPRGGAAPTHPGSSIPRHIPAWGRGSGSPAELRPGCQPAGCRRRRGWRYLSPLSLRSHPASCLGAPLEYQ